MLDRIVSDFVKGVIPGAQGAAETGLAVMDMTFSAIFQAIQDTGRKLEDEGNRLFNPHTDDNTVNGEQVVYVPSPDENVTDTKTSAPKDTTTDAAADAAAYAASAAVKEAAPVAPKPGDAINKEEVKKIFAALLQKLSGREGELTGEELKKIDRLANLLTAKLNELAARDPGQFDKLMEKFSGMTMRDLARELDVSLRASEKLAEFVDLDQPIANSFEEGKLDKLIARLAAAQLNGAQTHKNEQASTSGEQPFSDALKESKAERSKTPAAQNAEGKNSQSAAGQQQGRAHGAEAYAAAQETANGQSARGAAAKVTGGSVEMGAAAGHTHGKAQAANAGAVKTPQAPRGEFDRSLIDQIIKNARFSTRANGVSNMVIHLEPAHLGKVNMKITVQDNVVKAMMIAENPEVRGAIEANLETLRASLQGQGLKVDQIVVAAPESGLDGRDSSFAQQFDQANGGHAGEEPALFGAAASADEEEFTAASLETSGAVHDGAVHVIA
ncbi:MAG: flagellar hook-length control protein FliK [Nitrospinae bacterium]|nr:flagellar hook-length control protein FliK [Nitrospinota bacterium]